MISVIFPGFLFFARQGLSFSSGFLELFMGFAGLAVEGFQFEVEYFVLMVD